MYLQAKGKTSSILRIKPGSGATYQLIIIPNSGTTVFLFNAFQSNFLNAFFMRPKREISPDNSDESIWEFISTLIYHSAFMMPCSIMQPVVPISIFPHKYWTSKTTPHALIHFQISKSSHFHITTFPHSHI